MVDIPKVHYGDDDITDLSEVYWPDRSMGKSRRAPPSPRPAIANATAGFASGAEASDQTASGRRNGQRGNWWGSAVWPLKQMELF